MTQDLKIIGDNIEFMGFTVGKLEHVCASIREDFVRAITQQPVLTLSQKNGRK